MLIDEIWSAINNQENAERFWSKYLNAEKSMFYEVKNFIDGPTYFNPILDERGLKNKYGWYVAFRCEALFLLRIRVLEKREDRDTVLRYLEFLINSGPSEIKNYAERMRKFILNDNRY